MNCTTEIFSLCTLKEGQSAYVADVEADSAMRRRLLDIGLIPGTRVTCMAKSPAGDPAAYRIRGAIIALRGTDARGVHLEGPLTERLPLRRTALA